MNIKYVKYPLTITVISGIMFSCGIINKKYESPTIEDSKLYRAKILDSSTIADIPLKTFFKDPYLQELIQKGMDGNLDLKIATTRIYSAEASLKQSRMSFFPTLNVGPQVTLSRLNDAQRVSPKRNMQQYQLSASTGWEIDIWGKLNSKKKAALANYMQTESYKRVVMTSLVANIASSYYQLLALDKQLEITKNTVKLLKESSKTMQALMDANIVTGAAVQQSLALQYATEVTIPDLQNNIRQIENNLSYLLGIEPNAIKRSKIDLQGIPAQMEYGVPAQLLSKRPDVQSAELAFRSAFEMTNVAKASMYPSLTLSGNTGWGTVNTIKSFFDSGNFFFNLIGGLTQPLFNGRVLRSNLEIAKAQQEESYLSFKEIVLNAGVEVSNALSTYHTAKLKVETRNNQIKAYQNSVDFTKELVKYGNANYTEVITAEQSLLSAQLGQVEDQLQQLQSAIELYRALGGGVD